MARRAFTLPPKPKTVAVRCHAVNPDPKRGGECGQLLGHVPGGVRFVGLSTHRVTDPLDGRIRLQCPRRDCRTWNVFEAAGE